ncbi:MAG: hypothetical protein KAV87_37420 [Desulfobacteraceae bacterium]|nr:hypothetical protein [Desulfobacteraceae bacterium]
MRLETEKLVVESARELKEYLRTGKKCLRIKTGRYIAVFDRCFCQQAQPLGFIRQIDALMDAGKILKNSDTSYVSRLTWNGRNVVAKRYNHRGLIHSLRHTIKRSRARRGWLHAHRLGMLGIATPGPLAYIEKHKGLLVWKSYLVTEYVAGQNLYDFLRDSNITEQQRADATARIKQLLDKLGRYRISHGDLKHTNILITDTGPVLTDLDGMKTHKWNWMYKVRRAKDLKRFLRKTTISPTLNNYCRMLISKKLNSFKKFAGDFDKMQIDNWSIYARKNFPKHNIRQLILAVDKPNEHRSQLVKVPSSDTSRVFKCDVSPDAAGHILYLKQYLWRSVLDFVKHLFRASRGKRAFKASLMLEENGFDAPAVIALFELCLGPFRTDSLLLTSDVENARSVPELFEDICRNSGKDALIRKRNLIRAFAETVGRLHAKGIFHGDLRLGNVLVREEGKIWRFFLIDNERTKKFYRLPTRLRLKNLVQVNMFRYGISRTDRLRFFKSYLEKNPLIACKQTDWVKKVITKTNWRLKNTTSAVVPDM